MFSTGVKCALVRHLLTVLLQVSRHGSLEVAFASLDLGRTGALSCNELQTGCRSLKLPLTNVQLARIFRLFDADKSGEIDAEQFGGSRLRRKGEVGDVVHVLPKAKARVKAKVTAKVQSKPADAHQYFPASREEWQLLKAVWSALEERYGSVAEAFAKFDVHRGGTLSMSAV